MKKIKEPKPMHHEKDCYGHYCPFHNPSDHHMKDWQKVIRYDRGGLTERICKHGVGHPDPDSLAWLKSVGSTDDGTHGCCGESCCSEPVFDWDSLVEWVYGQMGQEFYIIKCDDYQNWEEIKLCFKEQYGT